MEIYNLVVNLILKIGKKKKIIKISLIINIILFEVNWIYFLFCSFSGVCEEGEIERDKNFKYMTIIKNASTGKLGHQNKDKENVPNTPKERKSKNKDTLFQSDGSKDQKDDYYQKYIYR